MDELIGATPRGIECRRVRRAGVCASREEQDRPIWLGEWGENTEEWQSSMAALMERHDVGWAVYPWKRKQTWFFNPVLQRIPDSPGWYEVAKYLAQPSDGAVEKPDEQAVEEGMAEILDAIELANCIEDAELAAALIP